MPLTNREKYFSTANTAGRHQTPGQGEQSAHPRFPYRQWVKLFSYHRKAQEEHYPWGCQFWQHSSADTSNTWGWILRSGLHNRIFSSISALSLLDASNTPNVRTTDVSSHCKYPLGDKNHLWLRNTGLETMETQKSKVLSLSLILVRLIFLARCTVTMIDTNVITDVLINIIHTMPPR